MTDSVHDKTKRFRAEWLALVVILMLIAAVFAQALYRIRASAETQEGDHLQVQARVVDDNLIRQLEGVNHALAGIRDELERPGHRIAWAAVSGRLKMLGKAIPGVRTMAVLGGDGTIVASSRDELLGTNSSQREIFETPRQRPNRAVLYVSEPFKSPLGPFVVAVSRVLTGAQGEFAGIVVATLDPEYFQVVLRSVLYAPDMRASLAHGAGKVFVNMPMNEQALGMSLAKPGSLFTLHQQSGRLSTLITGKVLATGDVRMMAIRTLNHADLQMDKPLVAAVSREVSAIFLPWRNQALRWGLVYAVVVLASTLGLYFSQRRRRAFDRLAAAAAKERQESAERLELALEGSGLALFDWDIASDRIFHSAQAAAMRGEPAAESTAPIAEFQSFVHPDDLDTISARLKEALTGVERSYHAEFRIRKRSGAWLWLRARGRVVEWDSGGRALRLAGTYADINERKIAEERLRRLAEFDTLTDLPNRAQFLDRLHQAMARATRDKAMALLFLDVDHFKAVNDMFGHEAGDQLLKTFASRMREAVRLSDTVARLGGDEFTIILEGLRDLGDAKELANKLVKSLSRPVALAEELREITVSVGVAMSFGGEGDDTAVLARADAALYEAKRRGRNGYFCDDTQDVSIAEVHNNPGVSIDPS